MADMKPVFVRGGGEFTAPGPKPGAGAPAPCFPITSVDGVDHKDRDAANWTASLKSNRFHAQIFCRLFCGVLRAMCTTIKVIGSDEARHWHEHLSNHLGQCKFQMDPANDLMSCRSSMDWSDVQDNERRPLCVQSQDHMPRCCKKCFFCTKGFTHGLDHKKKGERRSQSSHW
jgi:hypothetical protein